MKIRKKDLLRDMEKAYEAQEFYLESERRDIYYSALVKDIVKNNRTSQKLKCCFFAIVCLVFAAICIIGMIIILNISHKDNILYSDIGIAVTGFGSVLSSIIVLPKIIAKHLFPENSEEVRFKFIKDNQEFDQPIFDYTDIYDSNNVESTE